MKKHSVDCSKPLGQQEVIEDMTEEEIAAHEAQIIIDAEKHIQNAIDRLKQDAQNELDNSDINMVRLIDAVVRGDTTFNALDAKTFANYREELREVVRGNSSSKPTKPPYPIGT